MPGYLDPDTESRSATIASMQQARFASNARPDQDASPVTAGRTALSRERLPPSTTRRLPRASRYQQGHEFEQTLADLHHLREIGAVEQAADLMREHGADVRLGAVYEQAQRQLGKLNALERRAQFSDMGRDKKRARLDLLNAMRNRLAKTLADHARAMQP